ncbi:cupredoxin domain-containing protein [Salinarchaeum laminariae]|uniref:cupredoxin domain-containing protein n=1 Tax=Salinarchaeum laminariae TaxID=869888 RepID=UPI0020C14E65|nr:plastocyanin/azurin family copper-binding protein [Salinarchaeum laminariae]
MVRATHTRRELIGRLGAGSVAAIGVAVAGCMGGDDGGGGGDGNTVTMGTREFQPSSLTVETGATVTWENDSTVGHTVTAYDDGIPEGAAYFASGGFDSEEDARNGFTSGGLIESDQSFEHTFETAGTYEYFCIPHEGQGMTGTITVESSSE